VEGTIVDALERETMQIDAAKNQSLYREVNEQIERLRGGAALFVEFVCECTENCSVKLPLTIEEYESVRRVPTHFLVKPGHTLPDVERVVMQNDRYVEVEKFGAAGPVAILFDRRSHRNGPS
jgi:hypothetical protein